MGFKSGKGLKETGGESVRPASGLLPGLGLRVEVLVLGRAAGIAK